MIMLSQIEAVAKELGHTVKYDLTRASAIDVFVGEWLRYRFAEDVDDEGFVWLYTRELLFEDEELGKFWAAVPGGSETLDSLDELRELLR